ncbi:MAG: Cytochrome c family protein, partial [uncultured Sulfurovum sp.]
MKKLLYLLFFIPILLFSKNSCIACHNGIEHIRDHSSKMMQEILEVAEKAGAKGNDCVVCHGGNPRTDDKNASH